MSPSRALLTQVWKELRVLAPVGAGGAAGLFVLTAFTTAGWRMLAYVLTALVLGALAFGHELMSRTLPLLLAQPVGRTRLWAIKIAALAAWLAPLYFAAAMTIPTRGSEGAAWLILAVPIAAATVVPALTLATRSALAGVVLAAAIPLVISFLVWAAALARFGWSSPWPYEAREFASALGEWLFIGACAAGAPAAWWLFRRAEAVDGAGRALFARARPVGAVPSRRRHPLLQLAIKEVRLQHGTLAVAALFPTALLLTLPFVRGSDPAGPLHLVAGTVWIHGIVVALMAGASASAEERQFGTIEMQLLVPIAASTQWAVKCAVVFLVMLLLAAGLPWMLAFAIPPPVRGQYLDGFLVGPPALAALTTAAMYVSSLSSGGARALALSLPVVGAAMLVGRAAITAVGLPIGAAMVPALSAIPGLDALASADRRAIVAGLAAGLLTAVLLFVQSLALANHRLADRSPARVVRHAIAVLAVVALAAALVHGLSRGTAQVLPRSLLAAAGPARSAAGE